MEEVFIAMIVIGGAVFGAYSPIARGIGDRIRYGRMPAPGELQDLGRVDDLSGEMASLRQQLHETQERLDFHERMIAQTKVRDALPGAR